MKYQPMTPAPWYYVTGAVWTTPNGPDDGGQCILQRASAANLPPTEKDANLHAAAALPELLRLLSETESLIGSPTTEMFIDNLEQGRPRIEFLKRLRDALTNAGIEPENLTGRWHTRP